MSSPEEWLEPAVLGIFERRVYANNGPIVQALDRALADAADVPFGAAFCSGMIGMLLTAKAVFSHGEIIVPENLPSAMKEALIWGGFDLVLAEVDDDRALSSARIIPLISDQTTGLVAAHTAGDIDHALRLERLSSDRNLPLIFDGGDAIGRETDGRRIGGFGTATVFSFEADSVGYGADGGGVVTRREGLWKELRTMRNFHAAQTFAEVPLRMNGKMGEAAAAAILSFVRSRERTRT